MSSTPSWGAWSAGTNASSGEAPRIEDELWKRERAESIAKIAVGFVALAGSQANAMAVVEALHDGMAAELVYPLAGTDPEPKVIAIVPPTGPMHGHDVRMALMLTRDALVAYGILRPTGEQLQAALLGGEVPVPGIRTVEFRGVLRRRADGLNWGQIASERYHRPAVTKIE
jgi:hypothetical protein